MMMLLVLAAVLCVVSGRSHYVSHETFNEFLQHVQTSYSHHLSESELLLLGELVMAVDDDDLKASIDRLDFENIIKLIGHMSDSDAHYFENYLIHHLGYTHRRSVERRFRHPHLISWLNHHVSHDNDWFRELPYHLQQIFQDMKTAATDYRLQEFVNNHYIEMLEIMEHLDGTRAEEFNAFLIKHLDEEKAEAAAATAV